jgi:peptidoglycan/LPS O-acetylase OafA/YrhL
MRTEILKNYGDTNFITGMRAYAALAVVLIHAGGAGLRSLGEIGNRIVDLSQHGVAIFFVISGYSVTTSFVSSNGYKDYINKRLFRIAPLYYFWLMFSVLAATTSIYWQSQFHSSVSAYNIMMHLSFLSYLDYKIANTILSVEWSIPIEIFWYFLLPFLIPLIQSKKTIFYAILLGGLIYVMSYLLGSNLHVVIPDIGKQEGGLLIHWSPFPYAFGFLLGIAAFRLRESGVDYARFGNYVLSVSILFLVAFIISPVSKFSISVIPYIFFSILAFVLIVFGSSSSILFNWLFANKVSIYIGTISYGIYLCHIPLLILIQRYGLVATNNLTLMFLFVFLSAVFVSTLTYYLIERPGFRMGRSFYSYLVTVGNFPTK